MAKAAKAKQKPKPKAKPIARAKASALVAQPAHSVPGVKKQKKKSFVVIVAPGGTAFPAATTVSDVRRISPELIFTISGQPKVFSTHILLSIKGPNNLLAKERSKKRFDDTPDPGNLTITLTNQGANIEPIVTVPVVFVDDFDP